MSYNSNFTGRQVEELIGQIGQKKEKFSIVEVDESSLSFVPSPNTIYNCVNPLTDISIISFDVTNEKCEEYVILFNSGDNTTLTLPTDVFWANGEIPKIESNEEYELSISKRVVGEISIFKAILVPFKTVV